MRKEILITNYYPNKLREARGIANFQIDDFVGEDIVDTEKLRNLEEAKDPMPIDIFFLAYLFVTYKSRAEENGINSFFSLTTDIMYPHPKGLEYQEFIVAHDNYRGIPINRKANGQIKWVATIKTEEGQQRIDFWEKKRSELGIDANHVLDSGIRQKVAFANHPTKKHVCLFSGSELYIDYRCPSPNRINMINKGVEHFIEIGPGKVLSGLIRRINKEVNIFNINSIDDITNYINK